MIKKKDSKDHRAQNAYKVIISELEASPFHVIKGAFALMGVIPLLVLFYLMIGKNFFSSLLLGSNSFIAAVSIFISIMGFLYAYRLISNMVKRLLSYLYERSCVENEKTELVLGVSHDLRTHLTIIKSGIENLLDGVTGCINELQTRTMRICFDSVRRLSDFTNELLEISKIGFVRTDMRRDFVDFAQLLKSEISGFYESARKNGYDLRYKILSKDSGIWADERKLSKAVVNLLSSVVEHTSPGGGIEVTLSSDEDAVRLTVINGCPGVQSADLKDVYKKYTRVERHAGFAGYYKPDRITSELSIVKDIVDLHKGHLTVESEPEKEMRFSMVLPRDLRRDRHI